MTGIASAGARVNAPRRAWALALRTALTPEETEAVMRRIKTAHLH